MSSSSSSSSSGGGEAEEEVPYFLMPVAAVLGMYSVAASIRALYQAQRSIRHRRNGGKVTAEMRLRGDIPQPLLSVQYGLLVSSIIAASLAYGYVTAVVNNAVERLGIFDPYDLLGVDVGADTAAIKAAYRSLSKVHHPDKGGDEAVFRDVALAYRTLTDAASRENWEKHGHPDGPRGTQVLSFALPSWLLHPEGNVALVLVVLYLAMFVGIAVAVVRHVRASERTASKSVRDSSVAGADVTYLASNLSPASTHLQVLFLVATAPESIDIAAEALDRMDELRDAKLEQLAKTGKANNGKASGSGATFDIDGEDGGGWADDVDDDDDEDAKLAAAKARAAEEERRKEMARLAAVAGKTTQPDPSLIKLEGVDDGVLGQKWVESTLANTHKNSHHDNNSVPKQGVWPPTKEQLGVVANMTFSDYEPVGKYTAKNKKKNRKKVVVGPLECRPVRRNLCMTMGRLNAQMLNSHPELVEAGQKGLIDPTYFKATMEFRQRSGLLLEAALRIAMSVQSYRLAKTIVEAVAMFKIGTMSHNDASTLKWFTDAMKTQYGGEDGVPRLEFLSKDIETPGEDEIATGDVCSLALHIERKHAEKFTQQKLAQCQKQGIPPQVAMQTYREGWWIMIRARKVGGDPVEGEAKKEKEKDEEEEDGKSAASSPLMQLVDEDAKKKFETEKDENRLLCAWPFIVSNVAQQSGKVNVKFRAPDLPGKYEFLVAVKSQEFLGADQEFSIVKDVLDKEEVERKQREEEGVGAEEEGEEQEEEGKKEEEEEGTEPKKTK